MPRKKSMGRAANGNGTIRKKTVTKNGTEYTSWEGRVTVGYDPGTGKQIQKSVSGKTQKEVRQKLSKIIVELDEGTYQEPSKMTVGEWLDIWTEEYMGDKKYSTVKTYKAQIETHIKPGLGAVKLSQLVPHMVQKFYNDLLAGGQSVPKRDKAGKIIKSPKEHNIFGGQVPRSRYIPPELVQKVFYKALCIPVCVGAAGSALGIFQQNMKLRKELRAAEELQEPFIIRSPVNRGCEQQEAQVFRGVVVQKLIARQVAAGSFFQSVVVLFIKRSIGCAGLTSSFTGIIQEDCGGQRIRYLSSAQFCFTIKNGNVGLCAPQNKAVIPAHILNGTILNIGSDDQI